MVVGRRRFLLMVGAALAACGEQTPAAAATSTRPFMHGSTLAGFAYDAFRGAATDRLVGSLVELGVDWVAVAPGWYQIDAFAGGPGPHPELTPDDADLLALIGKARAAGLRVLLKPFVDSLDGTWRGELRPADLDAWLRAHSSMQQHYAALAEEAGADLLAVGVELNFAEEGQAPAWRRIIRDIRTLYGGPLTYAANHAPGAYGGGYRVVPFWDALDFIGIDAYFPLDGLGGLSVAHLTAAWGPHLDRIAIWRYRQALQQPVLFTELGYESAHGAAATPWGVDRSRPVRVDLQLQADLYTAFFRGPYRRELLGGVFWWRWNPLGGGPLDSGFAPNGKPTVEALRRALTADRRRPTLAGRS